MSQHTHRLDGRLLVGWREWLGLPALGIGLIRAKVDTGARSSALHVDSLECFRRGGREMVRFTVTPGLAGDPAVSDCEAEVADRRRVTDSGGHATERIFIHTSLSIADLVLPVEINLTDRRNMLFPMLLGRTAMAGRLLVDPDRSFALGEPPGAPADPPP